MKTKKKHLALKLYDTTLRDGTQGEGVNFSSLDKIRIAQKLDDFGIHYIEGGWPGSNPKDVSFFEQAADLDWKNARITAFGSTRRKNTPVEQDNQVKTLLDARTPAVTFFGKTWLLHVTEVLGTSAEENLAMIRDTTRFLKEHGREVIYDAEHFFDGFKDSPDYALETLAAAQQGGADWLVLCDTNGGTLPDEVQDITSQAVAKFRIPIGIHSHDDSGVGVANALAAIRAGAAQVQGTINGYGERVGNCNLTTVIPNLQLKMRRPVVPDIGKLTTLSRFVDDLANCAHNIRAPYVGSTAFAHKGGMHVNAVQKVAHSFEHIQPETVGNKQRILVSELAGGANILMKAAEMGLHLDKSDPLVRDILMEVKNLEEKGYEFEAAEASLWLLIVKRLSQKDYFNLHEYHCTFRRDGDRNYDTCSATVKLNVGDHKEYTVAEGDGPVNALDAAFRKALRPHYPCIENISLCDYKVRIIDGKAGTAARTRVLIETTDGRDTWETVGVSSNIIQASWRALVDSVEYYLRRQEIKPKA